MNFKNPKGRHRKRQAPLVCGNRSCNKYTKVVFECLCPNCGRPTEPKDHPSFTGQGRKPNRRNLS